MKKVLVVVTSHRQLGNTGKPTGYYLPEVSHPFFALEEKGFGVDFLSPQGGKAPMDEDSRDLEDPFNRAFLERADLVEKLNHTLKPDEVEVQEYGAIFFAGGHGTMWDFPESEKLSEITARIHERGGIVASVCHGQAALVNVRLSSGKYLVDGKDLTAFSNDEEEAAGLTRVVPFLLESKLRERGANYSKAGLWQEKVVVSDRLITGQNPASAKKVGEEIARLLLQEYRL